MIFFFAALKVTLLYAIIALQQRLLHPILDPHPGNVAVHRISGRSLANIFFVENFGMPIVSLSLSMQSDFFKQHVHRYKVFHGHLVALLAPLLYLFVYLLSGDEVAAFCAAFLYALTFNFAGTVNQYVQPEHYELLFTLIGGSCALYGVQQISPELIIIGGMLLGLSQLSKMPALLSLWVCGVICYMTWNSAELPRWLVGAGYLTPLILYMFLRALYIQIYTPKTGREGSSIISLFRAISEVYLYYHRRNSKQNWGKQCLTFFHFIGQFTPVIFLALLTFQYAAYTELSWILASGFFAAMLIYPIRLVSWLNYSLALMLCISAGFGTLIFFEKFSLLLLIHLLGSVYLSWWVICKHPWKQWMFGFKNHPVPFAELKPVAERIRVGSTDEAPFLLNINNSISFVYLLAQRRPVGKWGRLLMGVFGLKINTECIPDSVKNEADQLVEGFIKESPLLILQSTRDSDWPIVNLKYIRDVLGLDYQILEQHPPYLIYILANAFPIESLPATIDYTKLLDADQGKEHIIAQNNAFPNHLY